MLNSCRKLWQHTASLIHAKSYSIYNVTTGRFWNVPTISVDEMYHIHNLFTADENPNKMNLSSRMFLSSDEKTWIPPSVHKAEEILLAQKMYKDYGSVLGLSDFYEKAPEIAFGEDSQLIKEERIAVVQTVGGTGAMNLAADFISKYWPCRKQVYLSEPTWYFHSPIMSRRGFEIKNYRYYNYFTGGLNSKEMLDDLAEIPSRSLVILQACGHNPTGVDPTEEDWCEVGRILKKKNLYAIVDLAYQGLASGDMKRDSYLLRTFEDFNLQFCVAHSFTGALNLNGERLGALYFVCYCKDEAARIKSQLEVLLRSYYKSPPLYSARVAAEILKNDDLKIQWQENVHHMATRMQDIRGIIRDRLVQLRNTCCWDHIPKQTGIYCCTGLCPPHIRLLRERYSIYLTEDGRMSMAGITRANASYVADAIHKATTEITSQKPMTCQDNN